MIFCGSETILKKGGDVFATANLRGNLYEVEVDIPMASANLYRTEAFSSTKRIVNSMERFYKSVYRMNLGRLLLKIQMNC